MLHSERGAACVKMRLSSVGSWSSVLRVPPSTMELPALLSPRAKDFSDLDGAALRHRSERHDHMFGPGTLPPNRHRIMLGGSRVYTLLRPFPLPSHRSCWAGRW